MDRSARLQKLRNAVVIGVNQFAPNTVTLIGDLRYQSHHYRLTKTMSTTGPEFEQGELCEAIRTELAEHALKEAGE